MAFLQPQYYHPMDRITSISGPCVGRLTIRGIRIRVSAILERLAQGVPEAKAVSCQVV